MSVRARSNASVLLAVGDVWVLDVRVTDVDGYAADDEPVITVTLPDGTTTEQPAVEDLTAGRYRATYEVGGVGRYVARAVTTLNGTASFTAWVEAVTTGANMPAAADLDDWLGAGTHSWSDEDMQDALDIEAANQRRVCRVPAVYSADLRGALLRRAQRHLALRKPRPDTQDEADGGFARQVGRDSEVRRLEAPYRRKVIG